MRTLWALPFTCPATPSCGGRNSGITSPSATPSQNAVWRRGTDPRQSHRITYFLSRSVCVRSPSRRFVEPMLGESRRLSRIRSQSGLWLVWIAESGCPGRSANRLPGAAAGLPTGFRQGQLRWVHAAPDGRVLAGLLDHLAPFHAQLCLEI